MTRAAEERLAAAVAAVKDELARVYTVWSLRGPTLEACTALTAMAQEEAGHARALLAVSGDQPPEHRLAFLEHVPDDWPELVGSAGTAEMAVEESFHEDLFRGWFRILSGDAPAVAERFRDAARAARAEIGDWLKA